MCAVGHPLRERASKGHPRGHFSCKHGGTEEETCLCGEQKSQKGNLRTHQLLSDDD